MDRDRFFRARLETLAEHWSQDEDVSALAEAVALCAGNAWPLPEWCVDPLCQALEVYNEKGERGRGTPQTRHATINKKKMRSDLVNLILAAPMDFLGKPTVTVPEACEEAAQILGKMHNVTGRMIMEDYYESKRTPK